MDTNHKESLLLETVTKVHSELALMNHRLGVLEQLPPKFEALERAFLQHPQQCLADLREEFVLRNEFNAVKDKVSLCVSSDDFRPIKHAVYGAIGLVCATVLGAVVALVVTTARSDTPTVQAETK